MSSPSQRCVVLVGHCGPDLHMLSAAVRRVCPGVSLAVANDAESLKPQLKSDCVLLINRVLEGGFDTESGVKLIEQLSLRANPPLLMLVSNYQDAQNEAVAAGARPGFGKSQLYHEKTATILREAVACEPIH